MTGAAARWAALAIGAAALQTPPATYTNSIGMELVLIKPGALLVGKFQPTCPPRNQRDDSHHPRARWTDADYRLCELLVKRDAMPGFTVTIPRAYYIGKHEVTQGEWKKVMRTNPSLFQGRRVAGDADRHPVDSVGWDDAQAFIRKLNAMERTDAYRLPTEFEWEYAARAGAADDPTWAEIPELAWTQQVGDPTTRIVGTKRANAWGLHDMLGNVWEWVDDYYNEKLFADPAPPRRGTQHVVKGAGFLGDVKNTIYSTHAAGPGSGFDVGFRVVRDVKPSH